LWLGAVLAGVLYIARKRRLVLRFLLRLDFCARNCRNCITLLGSCGYCRRLQIGCVLRVAEVRAAILGGHRRCGRLQVGWISLVTEALKAILPADGVADDCRSDVLILLAVSRVPVLVMFIRDA
jgi:hypothetical protein